MLNKESLLGFPTKLFRNSPSNYRDHLLRTRWGSKSAGYSGLYRLGTHKKESLPAFPTRTFQKQNTTGKMPFLIRQGEMGINWCCS